mmetsp:Transcript_134227/g.267875  ORF Transcript_134227/g.267875 Transcript_134227/m.267875 type:complete len:92 (+) Transcript_134227:1309-1584(+)
MAQYQGAWARSAGDGASKHGPRYLCMEVELSHYVSAHIRLMIQKPSRIDQASMPEGSLFDTHHRGKCSMHSYQTDKARRRDASLMDFPASY